MFNSIQKKNLRSYFSMNVILQRMQNKILEECRINHGYTAKFTEIIFLVKQYGV